LPIDATALSQQVDREVRDPEIR
ncbi:uncharacterized protein METZ01_LOCUS204413, partial [marine metagenome]